MSILIEESLLPKGAVNRPGLPMSPLYITIHETDNTAKGADARAHAAYLLSAEAKTRMVSWHYTVDSTRVIRHIPENETAFHAGDRAGDGNRRSIGIELCVNSDGDFEKTKRNASALCAEILMRKKGLGIVQHNRWNGKNCPRNLRLSGWAEFTALIRKDYLTLLCAQVAANGFLNSPDYWAGVLGGTQPVNLAYLEELFWNMARGK
jgi:N-acetylmuramoyl-L-alanine amidase CwlA